VKPDTDRRFEAWYCCCVQRGAVSFQNQGDTYRPHETSAIRHASSRTDRRGAANGGRDQGPAVTDPRTPTREHLVATALIIVVWALLALPNLQVRSFI
jgi:hypothetical protein